MNSIRLSQKTCFALLIGIAALFAGPAAPALASVCTLSDHIKSANTNTAVGNCPAGTSHDVITITEDIKLSEALPPITGTITIEGGGHTISGDHQFRIFAVSGGNLTVNNLTLTKGFSEEDGGAIRLQNGARVTIEGSTISESKALGGGAIVTTNGGDRLTINKSSFLRNESEIGKHGGAILAQAGRVDISNSRFSENKGGFLGGAIRSQAQVNIANTTFDKNTVLVGGAVIDVASGQTTMTHVTMIDNRGQQGGGPDAILRSGGSVILRNSIIANKNKFDDCAGGLTESSGNLSLDVGCTDRAGGDPMLGAATGSPAYYPLLDGSPALDTADARYCLETDQTGRPRPQGEGCDIGAIESAGAIPAEQSEPEICPLPDQIVAANKDMAVGSCVAGDGADTIYLLRDFTLSGALPRITTDITIEGNGHTINGNYNRYLIFFVDGGKLTVNNLTLTKGKGAIRAVNGGDVTVTNSRFVENFSSGGGGAIAMMLSGSELVVRNSSFFRNQTENSSQDGSGGAIHTHGNVATISGSSFYKNKADFEGGAINTANSGRVDISNSTFIGNRALRGGAVANSGSATSITHVTMLNNGASQGSAIWMYEHRITVKLRNSIIFGGAHIRCDGNFAQNIGNLADRDSCKAAVRGDPLLGDETGAPAYLPLQAGSPAIDAADARFCLPTDQRGASRPQGGGCDIGAFETTVGNPSLTAEQSLSDECRVTTTHNLNFRDGPNGNRIGTVPQNATLKAEGSAPGWINVVYQGESGWISADYVLTQGNCN